MSTTDGNGILFYESTDIVAPLETALNTGQTSVTNALNSTNRVFPVANQAARDAYTPYDGLTVYRLDLHRIEIYRNSYWSSRVTGQIINQSVSSTVDITVTHGLGATPTNIQITKAHSAYSYLFDLEVLSRTATTFIVHAYRYDGTVLVSTPASFDWVAEI